MGPPSIIRPPLPALVKRTLSDDGGDNNSKSQDVVMGGEKKPCVIQRATNRGHKEIRELYMRTGALSSAAGSAYLAVGNTKILATVNHPRVSTSTASHTRGLLNLNLRFAPFANRPSPLSFPPGFSSTSPHPPCTTSAFVASVPAPLISSAGPSRTGAFRNSREHQLQRIVREAVESVVLLERYPKCVLDLHVLVLHDDGGLLSASLNCLGLALVDAGVELMDTIAAASVTVVGGTDPPVFLLDCDLEEEQRYSGCGVLHIGMCPLRNMVCLLDASGPLHKELKHMMKIGESACKAVGAELREGLQSEVSAAAAAAHDECAT
eukprot:GHVQ01011289.1.p1 GENE.GHVQ01011289.1~~GHVQ01011289.1.p1  ORF type:complete len:322 (+),score=67.06 GHVQ01011289.1:246-1211(+)